jgi:hypothetical protein
MGDESGKVFSRVLNETLVGTREIHEAAAGLQHALAFDTPARVFEAAALLEDRVALNGPAIARIATILRRANQHTIQSAYVALRARGRTEDADKLAEVIIEYKKIKSVLESTGSNIEVVIASLSSPPRGFRSNAHAGESGQGRGLLAKA